MQSKLLISSPFTEFKRREETITADLRLLLIDSE